MSPSFIEDLELRLHAWFPVVICYNEASPPLLLFCLLFFLCFSFHQSRHELKWKRVELVAFLRQKTVVFVFGNCTLIGQYSTMCSNVNKGWICVQANVKHWSPDTYRQLVVLFSASCVPTAAAELSLVFVFASHHFCSWGVLCQPTCHFYANGSHAANPLPLSCKFACGILSA